ncbi:class I SAM-dependent DNA methyltransferase [Desulfoluna spongiiphila]|uniref:site-specific DNA-methyltransferase (adenine-specific) n=1 Tax=Desulfoluna spongiiphila TaxID=419481 RepID=A0A1G5CGP4_9BACT|nr:DNA methyltransferase [Desulfoluna spongiiphila]SCY01583.1 Type II restriction/modification system, DNA methylase subunit YeeA [Desulfoluna spongiiphila]
MNFEKLEADIFSLVTNLDETTFIYDLLRVYGLPKASITRLKKGSYNLSKTSGEILWKKNIFFKKEIDKDLHGLIYELRSDSSILRHTPRFIVVTNFKTLLALDTKTDDTLDIPIIDLVKHCDFFLPWAGMEKAQVQSENPADIKAAERMGRLYDVILEDNPTEYENDRHALNIFLSRLLFCFFAEDTGIFEDGQFINAVASHTSEDGSDLQDYLQKLFKVLSVSDRKGYPHFLAAFPYVNGGLFAGEYLVPKLSVKSRRIIIECGALNWKDINPDIFGSMIQAVVHSDQRGGLGMHYTSVSNVMKVIEPLFLNDLYDALEKAGTSKKKLESILDRLYNLRIFDPACGSGNFLIIAYKELCKLEIEIFKRLEEKQLLFRFEGNIRPSQFYGIELDDFAHETAKLSLWLAEHQMNLAFKDVFGEARPTLPLHDGGNIVCGNATRLDWEDVCPVDDNSETYVLGNPPYVGFKMQNASQKSDMAMVFDGIKNYKKLDYIACWFMLGARYIQNKSAKLSFVSTNSINQGEQVEILWPNLFDLKIEIFFTYLSFKWSNNAKNNAGVICVIIGLRKPTEGIKLIFDGAVKKQVKQINAYLIDGEQIFVKKRKTPISDFPKISDGSGALDGGNLVLNDQEKNNLIKKYPESKQLVRQLMGSSDFIKGNLKWCLWIEDVDLSLALSISDIKERIDKVRYCRQTGGTRGQNCINTPHRFAWINRPKKSQLIIPTVSSERRSYIPISYIDIDIVVSNSASVVHDPEPYLFAILSSRIHMNWVRVVAGRLKTDYRYTSALCYNTFPFPAITEKQRGILEDHAFKVLDERELYTEKTMAELYDPDKMPDGLRQAHHEMDLAVEKCYRARPFNSDDERLEYLFSLYQKMTDSE